MLVKETEKDSWSVVGCASTEPTNTSYPITTHTPNVHCPANINLSKHSWDVIKKATGRRMKPGQDHASAKIWSQGQNGPPENSPEKFPENSPGTIRPSTSTQPSIVLDRTVQHYVPEPFGYWGVGGSRECLPLIYTKRFFSVCHQQTLIVFRGVFLM